MRRDNLIKTVGNISSHQWGVVVSGSGGGCSPTIMANCHKFPQLVVRKWKRSESNKRPQKDI